MFSKFLVSSEQVIKSPQYLGTLLIVSTDHALVGIPLYSNHRTDFSISLLARVLTINCHLVKISSVSSTTLFLFCSFTYSTINNFFSFWYILHQFNFSFSHSASISSFSPPFFDTIHTIYMFPFSHYIFMASPLHLYLFLSFRFILYSPLLLLSF